MQVQQSFEWSVKFAGLVSPWWLVPAMLLAAGATVWLYRNQCKGLPAWQKIGLVMLRTAVLLALIFLTFKPSLIFRRILTYPGRILMVLDDSASMTAHDTALSNAEALRVARQLGQWTAGPESMADSLAGKLDGTITVLRGFERFSRGGDRKQDAFWDHAGAVRQDMTSRLDGVANELAGLPGVTGEDKVRVAAWIGAIKDLKSGLDTFFTGSRDPGASAYDDYERHVLVLTRDLLAFQAAVDDRALASGHTALKAAATAVRGKPRIDLLREKVARLQPRLPELAPGQAIQMVSLMSRARADGREFRSAELKPGEGPTDLTGCLKELLTEPSEFPLSAVLVLGDGRNLGGTPLRKITQEAISRQVPVYAAGIGSEREPGDLAIVSVRAPSVAVKGTPMRVRVDVRDSMTTTDVSRLQVFLGAVPVASDTVNLSPGMHTFTLEFTPADTGFFAYTVKLDSVPGEVFAAENNSVEFVTHVREDKVRVLFLDWKPRWETRFALNILQRLPYVELNSIIALVQEGARLPRGLQKGAWPESAEALQMYDLVVIGDIPGDLLSPAEWTVLSQWVGQKGKTLCTIGARQSLPVGCGTPLSAVLDLPAATTGTATRVLGDAVGEICLTAAGRTHVLTRALTEALSTGERTNALELASPTGLVLAGEGKPAGPLMSVRYAGAGKTLSLFGDDLWQQLHPAALEAHTELYAGLVSWALEGGFGVSTARMSKAELAVDARRFPPGTPVQVWVRGSASNAVIEAVRGNKVLASVRTGVPWAGAPACAVFPDLAPGEAVFRLRDAPETRSTSVHVFTDRRERIVLARDAVFLRELAESSGGRYVEFTEVESCFRTLEPRQRVETRERVWRLWGWGPLLAVLILALTVHWVWRKWVGLV